MKKTKSYSRPKTSSLICGARKKSSKSNSNQIISETNKPIQTSIFEAIKTTKIS